MNQTLTIILIILCVILAILAALYFAGRKMMAKQSEQQATMEAAKIVTSMLIIDKKKMKIKDAGFPKIVEDSMPWYAKMMKYPVVKAKVGPKIMTLMADPSVYELLPVKTECKVEISGIYITGLKSIRGQSIPKLPQKKGLFAKLRSKV